MTYLAPIVVKQSDSLTFYDGYLHGENVLSQLLWLANSPDKYFLKKLIHWPTKQNHMPCQR